jgi:cytochrome P450
VHLVRCACTTEDGKITNSIDLAKLKTETTVFSAVEEVSRYRATGVGVRFVTEDTAVGEGTDRYFLKGGNWLVISNQALHTDKDVWGPDADDFVATRFKGEYPHNSFRGFGNGASACCGKNFVLYNIASFLAILVMRFDVQPVGDVWEEPGQDGAETAAQVAGPVGKIGVKMTPREDLEKVTWEFSF